MDPLNYDNMSFIDRWFLESSESTPNVLDLQLMSLTADPKPPQLADQGFSSTGTEPSLMLPPIPPFIDDVPLHHPPHVGGFIPEPPQYYPFDYWPPHDEVVGFPNDLSAFNYHQQQQQYNGFHQLNYGFPSVFPPMASSSDHSFQMPQQVSSVSNDNAVFIQQMQESSAERENTITGESVNNGHHVINKRTGTILQNNVSSQSKEKKPRARKDKPAPTESSRRALRRKTTQVEINGVTMDISGIPTPFCTCTGTPRLCYRWGLGGWQSSCCTNSLSSYPLPLSTKRHGSRISGRKMSLGGFKKVLEKLASEGHDFSDSINLRSRWSKHGTNKFVTIR